MRFFTLEKIAKLLVEVQAAVHREVHPIPRFKFIEADPPGAQHPGFDDSRWANFAVGDYWGGYDTVAWFRARVSIPAHLRSNKLALRFLVGPRDGGDSTAETMLYVNGVTLQGIDVWHESAWLPPEHVRDEIVIALRAWSGVLGVPDRRRFKLAQLVWVDEATESFYFLADTLLRALRVLDDRDLRHVRLRQVLDEAFTELDFARPGSEAFYESVSRALGWLRERLAEFEALVELKPSVVAVGHAHIDMAWLWRLSHSREKAGRTFATALHLMRQYPDYRFTHSSPQLYQYLKNDFPELFAQIKERIARGEWEITGGTWIEPDTNLPGGESLVRQFLFGTRYVQREFGVTMSVLWLPDVFGYPASLPQLIAGSGLKYFMTSKLSWNQTNRFPHDTFRWRGIDGTEILTHFITTPEDGSRAFTYNGQLRPSDVKGIWDHYQQKDVNDELLMLFGWGDGGGGPTQAMIEWGRAQRNLPGLPRVEFGTAERYFARLGERVVGRDLPVWEGELYLEYHRGTYTSQAANKRANRQAEVLYHDAEWLCALAGAFAGSPYPRERLNAGWELILLNQFHDILPGSSIRAVYEDSLRDYATVREIGEAALGEARATLLENIRAEAEGVVVFNSLSWARGDVIELPWSPALEGRALLGDEGRALNAQVVEGPEGKRWLAETPEAPSLGYRFCALAPATGAARGVMTITPERLENDLYRITLNAHGQITALFDKRHGREVLQAEAIGNELLAFQDKPLAFDAWDIDPFYQEKTQGVEKLIEATVEETGPVRGALRLVWRFRDSTITQRVTLYARSPRIDFRTEVDWRESQMLLKVAFPVAVRAARATYEIQFGCLERPTHWNTSWDWARFEVPAHKWADLSEGDYGVALLNDCKYGYDIKDSVMRLTLIKSAIRPDALADKGAHTFTYSLLPHAGDWRTSEVIREAHALNYPLRAASLPAQPGAPLTESFSFVAADAENVVVETVKRAEDDAAWIVRVYENRQSRRAAVTLTFGRSIKRALECNLVEQGEGPVDFRGSRLTFAIRPFEVKTFKVWL